MAEDKENKRVKERDKIVVAIIQNYEKLSPYNRGRLSMMAEMLEERYPMKEKR